MDEIEKRARDLLAAEYERDGHLGVAHTLRYGYRLTPAQDKGLAAIAAALSSAQVPEGVDWRDQYKRQTAMRPVLGQLRNYPTPVGPGSDAGAGAVNQQHRETFTLVMQVGTVAGSDNLSTDFRALLRCVHGWIL